MIRLLIVDDNRLLVDGLCDNFESYRSEYKVTAAYSGDETMELIKKSVENKEPFHVLLLDIRMETHKAGFEVLREIKKISPDTIIIMHTGYPEDFEAELGKTIYCILEKPQIFSVIKVNCDAAYRSKIEKEILQGQINNAKTANDFRRTLVSFLSHDIKNILWLISGRLQIWKTDQESEPGDWNERCKEYDIILKLLKDAVYNLDYFNEKIKKLDNISPGKVYTNDLKVYIEDVLANIVDEENISIKLDEFPEDHHIIGDPIIISQIIKELVRNAIDAIGTRTAEIHIGSEIISHGGYETFDIFVWNSGSVISESNQEIIFSPRFSTKDRKDLYSRGMGLAFARMIAKFHNGDLELISSTEKSGTKFVLSIPAFRG